MADNNRSGESAFMLALGAFAVGAFVGAVTALLLATQSGAETREDIRQGFEDVKNKLTELGDEAMARSKALADKGRELIEDKAQVVKSAIEAGRDAARRATKDDAPELPAGEA